MPLKPGKSEAAIAANVAELRRSGRPEKQAVAIAYATAGEGRRKEHKRPVKR